MTSTGFTSRIFLLALLHGTLTIGSAASKEPPTAIALDSDRLIVRLKPGAASALLQASPKDRQQKAAGLAKRLATLAGEAASAARTMADGAQVIRLGEVKNKGQLVSILARMSQDPDVQEILPDRVFFPALVPNDSQFSQQWALSAANGVNAPGAWDIGTGSPTLVVAVLDTGRLPHDDLGIRWIGGYDFVSAVERGNDGDPRDGDSSDPGDWVTSSDSLSGPLAGCPVTDSRWHGTAMAGVIGAIANNGSGIAGLNWNSRLLPVRVIGKCGGYESDIADGLRWSVGLSVPGLPVNPNPARLVNMSLASTGLCTSALQAAVTDVTATGVAIIAAAGNNGASAIGFSPGNCAGVIAVGAVDKNGGKPAYSNFGTPVALSAPGGSGTAVNEAILTTFNQGLTSASANNDFVQTVTGTSVAAAHITGIASLMLSVNPDLTPEDLRDLIANSARAFPTSTTTVMPGPSQADCSIPLCGTGIANAQAAVQLAFEWRNVSAQIAAGRYYALGLRTDGKVFAWGLNSSGQLGDGTNTKRTTPVQTLFAGIRVMATGHASTLALRVDGTVWAVGENTFGQLGDGSTVNRSTPVQIPNFTKVASIAVGTTHAIASRTDGTVWTWGRNEAGQLGDGTTLSRASPGLVPGLATVTQVAAGNSRSFALKADGTVWAWGNNTFGALGNGNSVNQLTPVQVIGVSNIARIATHSTSGTTLAIRGDGTLWVIDDATPAQFGTGTDYLRAAVGDSNFLAVRSAGEIWSWGNNYNGSLGRGTTINQTAPPAPVTSLNSTVGVSAAGCHSMALKADGTVWMWGYNNQGQLGNLNSNPVASAPLIITTPHCESPSNDQLLPAQVVGPGGNGFLFLDQNAGTFIPLTGLPLGGLQFSNPILLSGIANGSVVSIVGGAYRIDEGAFTSLTGTVNAGQRISLQISVPNACGGTASATLTVAGIPRTLTASTLACDTTPEPFLLLNAPAIPVSTFAVSNTVTITGVNTATPVSIAGGEHSVGCTGSFTSAPGSVNNGQTLCVRALAAASNNAVSVASLTVGTVTTTFTVFSAVAPAFNTPPQIKSYFWHALGLRSDGAVFAWGDNQYGGHGTGTMVNSSVPVRALISGVTQVGTGYYFSAALRADGTVWTWGVGSNGQLGTNSTADAVQPAQVPGLTGITMIAVGGDHMLARKSDGTVWAWGRNASGQIGNGLQNAGYGNPVQVPGLTTATHIAAGDDHSVARKSDGTVLAWGGNSCGQLGDGSNTTRPTPVTVPALTNVSQVAAGGAQTATLKNDGTVWSFGCGPNGNGTAAASSVPVQATGLTGVVEVVTQDHTLARTGDGSVWSWGANVYGQLGVGNTTDRLVPTQISVGSYTSVGTALFSSYAVQTNGVATAWGDNEEAQLGYGFYGGTYNTPFVMDGEFGIGTLNLDTSVTTFSSLSGVAQGSLNTSNAVIFNTIAAGTPISISGGEYRIGDGSYTSVAGTLNPGQSATVRQTASLLCNTSTTATLTVGALTRTYTVTTLACDAAPTSVVFLNQVNVAASSVVTSNTVTVSGINQPVNISVAGGQYSIGCTGTFVSTAGSISNGQTVCVRLTAAAVADSIATAALTLGSSSFSFRAITPVAGAFSVPPRIAGGNGFAIGLQSDGTVWGWGNNTYGQIGDGTTVAKSTPTLALLSGVQQVSAGANFAVALRSDGTVWVWGRNDQGQLGDGTFTNRRVPQPVAGLVGITHIAAGWDFVVARKSDGTVWGWGYNLEGQLADGTQVSRTAPVQASGFTGASTVAAGLYHALATKADGSVWAWGYNANGQLGDGSTTDKLLATQLSGITGVTRVAAGEFHSLALKNDATLLTWGGNLRGQLGDGTTTSRLSPAVVPGFAGVIDIAASRSQSMARTSDGSVWAWGGNASRQIGDGTFIDRLSPLQVLGVPASQAIGAGWAASYAIDNSGVVWSWGGDASGELGDGAVTGRALAARIPSTANDDFFHLAGTDTRPDTFAFSPAFGVMPNAVVTANSILVAGLRNGVSSPLAVIGGEVSVNGGAFTTSPGNVVNGNSVTVRTNAAGAFSTTSQATVTIGGASGRAGVFYVRTRRDVGAQTVRPQVAAGNGHSYALAPSGIIVAAGYNGNGQLANGTTFSSPQLRPVGGVAGVVSIASGDYHGLALKNDGTLLAWGYNASGQLGDGTDTNTTLGVVAVSGLTNVEAIAAGANHSVARKADGTVWAWGLNNQGQVGNGSTALRHLVPVQVTMLSGATAIAAGSRHTLALMADGTVRAWGANESGQLGDGSNTQRTAPVAVSGLSGIIAIAAAGNHSLALKSDSTVVAWGNNDFGQLGDGGNTSRSLPGAVLGLSRVGLIAAGATHSLAVQTGGQLLAWGGNANAQLGDGTTQNRNTPFALPTPAKVAAVASGQAHTIAITSEGKLFLFGDNFFGQLGNKSGNYNPHSQALNVLRGDSVISGFGGNATSSTGSTSTSGSAVVDIAGLATDYDFGDRLQGSSATIDGSFKNQALIDAITGVGINVVNTGGSAFTLQSSTCSSVLAAGFECVFTVLFNPATGGDLSGRIEVQSSVVGSPEVRQLFGRGIAPATPGLRVTSTGSLNYFLFEPESVGTVSLPKPLTLTNTGNALLNVSSAVVSNGSADFSLLNTGSCASVAPGASCDLAVQFNPAAPNAPNLRVGTITLVTNAGTQTVALEGAAAPAAPGSAGIALIGVASRKLHGGVDRDLPIDRGKSINDAITVEPRMTGPGHRIVFQFNGPVTLGGAASLTDNNGLPVNAASTSVAAQGNEVVVSINGLADAKRVTVNLVNVNGSLATSASIGFLLGDVNDTGRVTAADLAGMKSRSGQPVTAANARFDINLSGQIDGTDRTVVKSRAGRVMP